MENTIIEQPTPVETQPTPEQITPEVQTATVEQPAPEAPAPPEEPKTEFPKPFELPTQKDPYAELSPEKVVELYRDKKEALLKAFGLDDFALGAIDYYSKTGSLAEYAEVKSVDYTKVPDSGIVERKLREQYAAQGLTEDEIKLLVEDELSDRYKQDPDRFSEREQHLGKVKMKADAANYRQTFIDRQQKFKAPDRTPVQDQPQMTYEQEVKMKRDRLLQDQHILKLVNDKKVQFGDTSSPYNYEVNPDEVVQLLTDSNYYTYQVALKNAQGQVVVDKDGNAMPDYAKLQKIAIYAKNMDQIEKQLINYGKTLGKKEVIAEAENPVDAKTHGSTPEADDVYAALNRRLMAR